MARTATVKIGDVEATFDGETFTCADESLANILNSALTSYRAVGKRALTVEAEYWPDLLADLAEAIANHCGGELVSVDPPEDSTAPEGAIY